MRESDSSLELGAAELELPWLLASSKQFSLSELEGKA